MSTCLAGSTAIIRCIVIDTFATLYQTGLVFLFDHAPYQGHETLIHFSRNLLEPLWLIRVLHHIMAIHSTIKTVIPIPSIPLY